MGYIYYEYRLYKKLDNDNWSTNYINLQGTSPKIRQASGAKKDTFSFNLLNSYNQYFGGNEVIEIGDFIRILAAKNTRTLSDSNILIDGVIENIKSSIDDGTIMIEGSSRTELLLSGLTFVTTTTPKTPPEIIQLCLDFHNDNNKNFEIDWDSNNPSLDKNGNAFPTYLINEFYKPMYSIIDQYSNYEYTGDTSYYFYVDTNNKLIWRPKELEPTGIINEQDCNSIDIKYNKSEIVNSLIIYCGTDAKGIGINSNYLDIESRAKNGAKWKYLTKTNSISTTIMQNEMDINQSSFDKDNNGWFPVTGAYPYTTAWGVECNNDSDYNKAIIVRARDLGSKYGKSYCDYYKNGRYEANIKLPFNTGFILGQLIQCNFPKRNYFGTMRIEDIQYDSYSVIIKIIEDEKV